MRHIQSSALSCSASLINSVSQLAFVWTSREPKAVSGISGYLEKIFVGRREERKEGDGRMEEEMEGL